MSQQDGLDVQCERQGIRKHDSTSSGLNKWKNDLLFIETGKTVRTGLFLMGEMKGGIIRILVLDMLSLKWALILNEDQTEVQEWGQSWESPTYK